jgi:hypothetical protein
MGQTGFDWYSPPTMVGHVVSVLGFSALRSAQV